MEKGLKKTKADGKEIRQATTAIMVTKAGSDLNWNSALGLEGSGLIQKSVRPRDWMDIRGWKRNQSQRWASGFGLEQLRVWWCLSLQPQGQCHLGLQCEYKACRTLQDQLLFSHHAICWHQCTHLSSQRHRVWGQLPLKLQYWLCPYLWKGGSVGGDSQIMPSWPWWSGWPTFFLRSENRKARFGDTSSFKENGTADYDFLSLSYKFFK